MKSGVLVLTFFALFWSGITLLFDVMIVRQGWQRWEATHFPSVPGRVTASEVERARGSKGSTYRPKIQFAYEVNGRRLSGSQYQFGEWSSSDSKWAHTAVATHPVGSDVQVYFDPADPARAVISVGFDGSELFLAMFLTPFNGIMLALWCVPFAALKRKLTSPGAGGARIRQRFGHTTVRLVAFPAWAAGIGASALAAFAGVFIVGFTTGFHPSLRAAEAAWAGVAGVGAAVFARRLVREQRGDFDLAIDSANERISLPQNCGRKSPRTLALSEVQSVKLERKLKTGGKGGTTETYLPTLVTRGGEQHALVEWYSEPSANEFCAWLRTTLGLAPRSE